MQLKVAVDFCLKVSIRTHYFFPGVHIYLFIPAVIGLNEGNNGYLYKASDKGFVPLFDETTNSVPTQRQDPQRKDLNGAGETRSWGAHNYSFLCNQTQLSFQFCVLCCRCFLQGLLNCPHGPLLAVQTLSLKLCNKVTLLCLVEATVLLNA